MSNEPEDRKDFAADAIIRHTELYGTLPSEFEADIRNFNTTYGMGPFNAATGKEGLMVRIRQLRKMLLDELSEIDDIEFAIDTWDHKSSLLPMRVQLADLMGDLQVYCASEMMRWGIPVSETLQIIMASNMSKLDADGKPIFKDGKLQKGPDYWKPEPAIERLLVAADKSADRGKLAEYSPI